MLLILFIPVHVVVNDLKGVIFMNYEKMWNELLKKLKFECEKVNGVNGSTKEDHIKFNALYSIVKKMEDLEGKL